jgi:imidazolonepropionase-like amidohydrolase
VRRIGLLGFAIAALASVSVSGASAQPSRFEERYAIISSGERVGHVVANVDGANVSIDYVVDNNGRGPRLQQQITLNAEGLPLEWRIEGRSLFGNAVNESFTQRDGRATWTSQADEGSADAATPALYVANDDTPWALGLYARALLAAPNHTRAVLPGGALRLDEVRRDRLGDLPVTIYRLTGLDLSPTYMMLDARGRLAATVSGGSTTVREGYEAEVPRLGAMSQELASERFRALQQRLAHNFDAPVRIQNVRIFDPASGHVGPLSTVVVFRDTIAAIEPGEPRPAAPYEYVIDGEGGTLVPGLHDMHAHVSMESALLYLAAGVTSVRDQGNANYNLIANTTAFDEGELAGPRIVRNGMLEGRSPYSVRTGIVADSLEEALEAVRWYSSHGYFEIKIYNSLHPDWVRPVIEEAHRLGMSVTGHVPAFVTPDQAIEAGYRDIAHINQLMLGWLIQPGEDTRTQLRLTAMARAANLDLNSRPVRRTIDLMRRNGVALDTTAVTLELLMLSRARQIPPTHAYNIDHMPIGYQRYRRRTFVPITNPEEDQQYRAAFQKLLDTLGLLHRRGIQLLPGTDDGTAFTVHRELELYVAAGISAPEALVLGTLRAEQFLGRDQRLGSIERGKLADFFLIPGDPTQNISAIREIRLTMRGGVAYLPSEIYSEIGIRPFASPVTIQAPSAPDQPTQSESAPLGAFSHEWHDDH